MKYPAIRASRMLVGAGLLLLAQLSFASAHIIHSDDGISEIRVPGEWAPRADISQSAALRIADSHRDIYLIANTYLPAEGRPMAFAEFARELNAPLLENLEDGRITTARKTTINGRPALEYEISGRIGDTRFAYLSTVIEGKRARHHLLGWGLEEAGTPVYGTLRDVAKNFRESAVPRQARERIDLSFNWPKQSESKFTFRSRKSKRGEESELRMSGVTSVRADADRLLISTRVTDSALNSSKPDARKADYLQNLLQQMTGEIPDYLVSAEGEFLGAVNMEAYFKRVEEAILKALPGEDEAAGEKARQFVKRFFTEETLTMQLADSWNDYVGNWAGGSYVPGEAYTYEVPYQVAALGNETFPMAITQQLTGRVPCHQDDKANSCVRLMQTARIANPAYTKAMHRFVFDTLKGMAGRNAGELDISIDGAEVVKTITLVAEPETMLPYELAESEIKTFVISEKGRTQTATETVKEVTNYVY